MNYQIILLGYKGYDFKDDTGKVLKGAKISYLANFQANEDLKKGCLPIQESCELGFAQNFQGVGIYDITFAMVPGKNNAPTSKIVSMSFVKPIDLEKLFKVA